MAVSTFGILPIKRHPPTPRLLASTTRTNTDKTSTQLQHIRQVVVRVLQCFPSLSKNTSDFLSMFAIREWAHFNQHIFHLTFLYTLYSLRTWNILQSCGADEAEAAAAVEERVRRIAAVPIGRGAADRVVAPAALPPRLTRFEPEDEPIGSTP